MARGKKTGGRNFTKGNKAGEGHGRPPLPPEVKAIRNYTVAQLKELITELFTMQRGELMELSTRDSGDAIKHAVASILLKTIDSGSSQGLESLLNRIVGKVPDHVKHEGFKPSILELTDGKQMAFTVESEEE